MTIARALLSSAPGNRQVTILMRYSPTPVRHSEAPVATSNAQLTSATGHRQVAIR